MIFRPRPGWPKLKQALEATSSDQKWVLVHRLCGAVPGPARGLCRGLACVQPLIMSSSLSLQGVHTALRTWLLHSLRPTATCCCASSAHSTVDVCLCGLNASPQPLGRQGHASQAPAPLPGSFPSSNPL